MMTAIWEQIPVALANRTRMTRRSVSFRARTSSQISRQKRAEIERLTSDGKGHYPVAFFFRSVVTNMHKSQRAFRDLSATGERPAIGWGALEFEALALEVFVVAAGEVGEAAVELQFDHAGCEGGHELTVV